MSYNNTPDTAKIQPRPALYRRPGAQLTVAGTALEREELPIHAREAIEIDQLARRPEYRAVSILGCPSLISCTIHRGEPAILVHRGLPDPADAPWRIDAPTWEAWKRAGYVSYL
jgi:hypothetical protein